MKNLFNMRKKEEEDFDARVFNHGGKHSSIKIESPRIKFTALLKEDEKSFLLRRAELECSTMNGILRKSLKMYQDSVNSKE